VIMNVRWARADEVRFFLLGRVARLGLAVVDFQVDGARVFRPTEVLPLLVTTEGHGSFPWVDGALLDWLTGDLRPGATWVVIEHLDGAYAQTKRGGGGYLLEARTGGPETHVGTLVGEPDEVARRLLAFARGDPSWRSGRHWESVRL
jgi:hypothetical protein